MIWNGGHSLSGKLCQMKATEQYFPVVLFSCGAVCYAVQGCSKFWVCWWNYAVQGGSFIWVCGWNPKVWPFKWKLLNSTFLWCCTHVYYAVQGGSKFWVCEWNPKVWPFKWKLTSSTFLRCCLLCCTRWCHRLRLWIKIVKCNLSSERYWAVLSCDAVY